MPTTRRTADRHADDSEPKVEPAEFDTPAVVVTPTAVPVEGDEAPNSGVAGPGIDARAFALANLVNVQAAPITDLGPVMPAPRVLPKPTTARLAWAEGDWHIVTADVYPRMIGETRNHARAGDVIRVPADDRTASDVALGYLVPEPDADPPL